MKKLMIAAAIVCAAAFAQAASLNWSVGGIQINGSWDTTEGDTADGYLVVLMDNATYSQATMVSDIAKASTGDTAWKTALEGAGKFSSYVGNADGGGVKSGIALDDEGAVTAYMVILNADTIDDATLAFVTENYTSTWSDSTKKANLNEFDDGTTWVNATNPAGWTSVAAVPEPTSGLLLLLGVAGLALRRRRA